MAIVVEHDKRRREILEKSLDVFAKDGYEDVTFQKIADRCGITRTTLYFYFKNKRDIFLAALKQLLSEMEIEIRNLVSDENIPAEETLRKVMMIIVGYCEQNINMFSVLLVYLIQLKKAGVDTDERVRRRVVKLRHLMSTVIIRGIKNKEFAVTDVHQINELLYGIVEAAIFRVAILNQTDISKIRTTINLAIDGILKK
jgi:AcrR family transcriptional regulator